MNQHKILMSGNEAIAEGALHAGCRFYAGYPITPQNELIAYMAKHLPERNGVFVQSESELSAINMVYGALATGNRAMTSSSSPGISLMQEGISYIAGAELPAVIVNVMRAGPGLGNIWPAQSDYFQSVKGGGNGDYHCLVMAPASVQESFDLTVNAFDLADKYRIPVIILSDGMLGQMMEPVRCLVLGARCSGENRKPKTENRKKWAVDGCLGRKRNIVKSFHLNLGELEKLNVKLQEKYKLIKDKEEHQESFYLDDSEIVLVAYGTMARFAKEAMCRLREEGKKVGLIRPITLWPFPQEVFKRLAKINKRAVILTIEMSYGQMLEDVRLACEGKFRVEFLGRAGGGVPSVEEIIKKIKSKF